MPFEFLAGYSDEVVFSKASYNLDLVVNRSTNYFIS